jgi:hypothetical protein
MLVAAFCEGRAGGVHDTLVGGLAPGAWALRNSLKTSPEP